MQTQSKVILGLIGVVLLAGTLMKVLRTTPVPDNVAIQNQIDDAATGASDKRPSQVLSVISDSYSDAYSDSPERLNILIRRGMSNVSDLDVKCAPAKITVNGNSADSICYVSIIADGQLVVSQPIELKWRKEATRRLLFIPDEAWRVVSCNYSAETDGN